MQFVTSYFNPASFNMRFMSPVGISFEGCLGNDVFIFISYILLYVFTRASNVR